MPAYIHNMSNSQNRDSSGFPAGEGMLLHSGNVWRKPVSKNKSVMTFTPSPPAATKQLGTQLQASLSPTSALAPVQSNCPAPMLKGLGHVPTCVSVATLVKRGPSNPTSTLHAPKRSAYPTNMLHPWPLASGNKKMRMPDADESYDTTLISGRALLPSNTSADARKNISVPQLTPSLQSSSSSDKRVVNKSSTVALLPSNNAAKTSLLSSGKLNYTLFIIDAYSLGILKNAFSLLSDAIDPRQIKLPFRSSLVSIPPSSVSSLAEPSLLNQSYDLHQLPAHSTAVRCLFINGPCLFSTSDDGVVEWLLMVAWMVLFELWILSVRCPR